MATSDIQVAEHALQHHFADMEQQQETSTFGMWMFLLQPKSCSSVGCSAPYLVYRASVLPGIRAKVSQKMNIWLGATNTAVLICSFRSRMALGLPRCPIGQA